CISAKGLSTRSHSQAVTAQFSKINFLLRSISSKLYPYTRMIFACQSFFLFFISVKPNRFPIQKSRTFTIGVYKGQDKFIHIIAFKIKIWGALSVGDQRPEVRLLSSDFCALLPSRNHYLENYINQTESGFHNHFA
ncbi:MAG: hypothetical protein WA151_24565, partial [Desulfatirhabdiaceae bacterium]